MPLCLLRFGLRVSLCCQRRLKRSYFYFLTHGHARTAVCFIQRQIWTETPFSVSKAFVCGRAHKTPETSQHFNNIMWFNMRTDKQSNPLWRDAILLAAGSEFISTFEQVTGLRVGAVGGWAGKGFRSAFPCSTSFTRRPVCPPPATISAEFTVRPPSRILTDQAAEKHIDTPLRSFALWRKLNLLF